MYELSEVLVELSRHLDLNHNLMGYASMVHSTPTTSLSTKIKLGLNSEWDLMLQSS